MQRSLLIFQNSIHSKETYAIYKFAVDKFMEYYRLRDYDGLSRMDTKMLQTMIEDYVISKKNNGLSRSTIKTPVAALELFCDTNDLSLNWKKIKRLLPQQQKKSGSKAYTTQSIQKMLASTTNIRNRAIIHFLASTGVRVGALSELKLKHIQEMPMRCKAVTVYPDDKEEYITFLTPEASSALEDYLAKRNFDGEKLSPDSPLFRENYSLAVAHAKSLSTGAIKMIVSRILQKANLRSDNNGSRKDVQLVHGFRKRFNTIMKTTDGIKIGLAEKMMGHSVTIPIDDVYLVASTEKLFEEFKKAIPELTVSDKERNDIEKQKLEENIFTLESEKDSLIHNLEREIERREKTERNVEKILKHLKLD